MSKAVNKIIKCDVVVVGAGVSGVCAAVAAARNNLQVLLVEKSDCLGGIATQCMHKTVCGLYGNGMKEICDLDDTLNKGITQELTRFLKVKYNVSEVKKMGKVFVLPLPKNSLKEFLINLLEAEKNIHSLLNTEISTIERQNNRVTSLIAKGDASAIEIIPEVIIDCSGESIVSKLAKIPYLDVDIGKQQLCGFIARITGIQNEDESLMIKIPYFAEKFVAAVDVPGFLKYTTFIPGDRAGDGYLKINMPYFENIHKEEYLTKLFGFMTEHVKEMQNAQIEKTSNVLFPRDSERIKGEYVLRAEDILGTKKFDDGVVKGAWPIEQWLEGEGTRYTYIKGIDYYEIPRRCLKSEIINNLFAAGKCISASQEALASTRVMGTCMSLGEASAHLASEMIMK
ncbi:MAG: FAD-dependent oxidoreductase [Planctomycetes bacterium]|nr:FAD-dependent oxidoreductase [Planctomycetota bacterium]